MTLTIVDLGYLGAISPHRPETLAWDAAATGHYSAEELGRLDGFFGVLDSNGILSKIDEMWALRWGKNADDALLGLKTLRQAAAVNSPTFTQGVGFQGDRSTRYINSTFVPSSHASQFTLNSGAVTSLYSTAETLPGTNSPRLWGVARSTGNLELYRNASTTGLRVNAGNTHESSAFVYDVGWNSVQRLNENSTRFIWDGSTFTGTVTVGTQLPSQPVFWLARNNGAGTPERFSDATLSFWSIGGVLSAQEVGLLAMAEATLRFGWHNAAIDWLDAASGSYSDTLKICLNGYIQLLDHAGIWSGLDRLFAFAFGLNASDAYRDLVSRSSGTALNGLTFTQRQGISADGTTSGQVFDTGYTPGDGNYQTNNASLVVHVRVGSTNTTTYPALIGAMNGSTSRQSFISHNASSGWRLRLNQESSSIVTTSGSRGLTGWFAGVRSASNALSLRLNNATTNGTNTSSNMPQYPFYLLGINNAGTTQETSLNNAQISFASIGRGFSSSELTRLFSITNLFHAAIGFTM